MFPTAIGLRVLELYPFPVSVVCHRKALGLY